MCSRSTWLRRMRRGWLWLAVSRCPRYRWFLKALLSALGSRRAPRWAANSALHGREQFVGALGHHHRAGAAQHDGT